MIDEWVLQELKRMESSEHDWFTIYEAREGTAFVDFGCNITDKGCRHIGTTKCCCEDCASHIGYMTIIEPGTAKTIARFFTRKKGFWREGKGCILPRKYRSGVCLATACVNKNAGFLVKLALRNAEGRIK